MSVDYAALANTIKIGDITSDEVNQSILHKLKNNDESLDSLHIVSVAGKNDDDKYVPIDGEDDMGWLGYFIGQNTKLQVLQVFETIDNEFYKGMSCNTSIRVLVFCSIGVLNVEVFNMLNPFFKINISLTGIEVSACNLGADSIRQLSLAIGGCSKSMKQITMARNVVGEGGSAVDIITALSMHPQLEKLRLSTMNIGRNEGEVEIMIELTVSCPISFQRLRDINMTLPVFFGQLAMTLLVSLVIQQLRLLQLIARALQ